MGCEKSSEKINKGQGKDNIYRIYCKILGNTLKNIYLMKSAMYTLKGCPILMLMLDMSNISQKKRMSIKLDLI